MDAVAELVVAVLPPEVVDGFEVCFRDELGLGEEHVATFLRCLSGQDNEETAGFFVGLPEVFGREVVLEEVKGDGWGGGGSSGGCGGEEGKGS